MPSWKYRKGLNHKEEKYGYICLHRCLQLGRRAFADGNCDDHLRNHGFILTPKGWKLSPVYDLTPNPSGTGLKLNIDESDNALDIDLVLSTASFYGISDQEANKQVEKLKPIIASWRAKAERLGISRAEQNMMEDAFYNL